MKMTMLKWGGGKLRPHIGFVSPKESAGEGPSPQTRESNDPGEPDGHFESTFGDPEQHRIFL